MNKDNPITQTLVNDWRSANSIASKLKEQIINRIDYIINTWFNIFDAKLDHWYFYGAAEGEVGDLSKFMYSDNIHNFYVEAKNFPDDNMTFIDKDGDEYCWQGEIPTRWLFDASFKEEIIKGKAEYERREEERKAKKKQTAAAKKDKDKKLVAEAKSKLSKEELAALKRAL